MPISRQADESQGVPKERGRQHRQTIQTQAKDEEGMTGIHAASAKLAAICKDNVGGYQTALVQLVIRPNLISAKTSTLSRHCVSQAPLPFMHIFKVI